jgi:signal transduction histidine kinase
VGLFLGIVLMKLTNPIHGLYFQTAWVTTPFPHLSVQHQLLHWITMGLAYSLAAIGYFMLVELFWQIDHDTKPLVVLVGLTGLPVLFDVLGLVSPILLDITYEPIGVAAFAAGVLFVYLEEFQTVRLAGEHDEPIIVLDDDDEVRDYNRQADEIFPTLESGERIDVVVPEMTAYLDTDDTVLEVKRGGGVRYYQVSAHPFSAGRSRTGRAITLTDITEREQYRTELERQNERLEQFASVVSHDLRNPLNVAKGRIELAREEHESEHLETASNALDRMEELTDELLTLAREGQPIDETDPVSLSAVAEQCWQMVDTQSATLTVEDDLAFLADAARLQQLLENLFRNAIEHAGTDVTIHVGTLPDRRGFYVEDDGPGIPAREHEEVFESGYSTTDHGTGFGLAIVKEIVDAHGWSIDVTDGRHGGARFEITGVDGVEDSSS